MILRTGKADVNVLDRSVRKRLGDVLLIDGDCSGTASAVVTIRTHHTGLLSVTGALNGLVSQGMLPETVRTDILLPPGSEESLLREMEDEICRTAKSAGVKVCGGHTEVTAAVTRPVVTAFACGTRPAGGICRRAGRQDGRPGNVIVQIGYAGLEGTFLLAAERREELETNFPVQMTERCLTFGGQLLMTEAVMALENSPAEDECPGAPHGSAEKTPSIGLIHCRDGGIFAALWRLSEITGTGFEVNLQKLALRQETIEFCSFYDVNPYQMASDGCMLAVMDPSCAGAAVEKLRAHGFSARAAGKVTEGRDRILYSGEDRQNLNRPAPDALLPLLG